MNCVFVHYIYRGYLFAKLFDRSICIKHVCYTFFALPGVV